MAVGRVSLPIYQSTECAPLLHASDKRRRISAFGAIILVLATPLLLINTDPSDPRVRRRLLDEWNTEIEKLKQINNDYKHQSKEWQKKLEAERRARVQARLYWADIRGDPHCIANGRKKYSALLMNLPESISGLDTCLETPITINGIRYQRPAFCEETLWGKVYGHWDVENEAVCSGYWESAAQKDCTAPGSGLRRVEAKFGFVHADEDPETLCFSTPITINGQTYERPLACPNFLRTGHREFWGIWDVADDNCK